MTETDCEEVSFYRVKALKWFAVLTVSVPAP
jgi:hypothetical protein